MDYEMLIDDLRAEASDIGVFFPAVYELDALDTEGMLHNRALKNRRVLLMRAGYDADDAGAPTEKTIRRYAQAVRQQPYGMVVLEPAAITPHAREYDNAFVLSEENADGFKKLISAIQYASRDAFGFQPVIVALLDHAGHHAVIPCAADNSASLPTDAPLLTDDEMHDIVIACSNAAKIAERAGCAGIGLNAADRSLFAESLAAFHRDGKFGGDFDDRTRFLRDCYTAMKMTAAPETFFTIRLCLSDGIAQPDGWGMGFEDTSAPDLYEPALLLKILQALYGVELVLCSIGIPHINWMCEPEPESDLIRYSRLCTCVAMLDSDMQTNVQLVLPELESEEVPFAYLAAGMIQGEFASFGGFLG